MKKAVKIGKNNFCFCDMLSRYYFWFVVYYKPQNVPFTLSVALGLTKNLLRIYIGLVNIALSTCYYDIKGPNIHVQCLSILSIMDAVKPKSN